MVETMKDIVRLTVNGATWFPLNMLGQLWGDAGLCLAANAVEGRRKDAGCHAESGP